MKKWVKIKDNKVIKLGHGDNEKLYKKFGLQLLDVEESEKGGWYLKGTAPVYTEDEIIENKFIEDKKIRDEELKQLTVTYDGITVQADEVSQNRIARVIAALPKKNSKVSWLDVDNNIVEVSKEQLQYLLQEAIQLTEYIWLKPHKNKKEKKEKQKK